MPWNAKTFGRHNGKASPSQASSGAKQANAILESTGDEGLALAVANKRIKRLKQRGLVSDHAQSRMSAGLDRDPDVDAASR